MNKLLENVKWVVFVGYLFWGMLYFSLNSIFRFTASEEASPIYTIGAILFCLSSLLFIVRGLSVVISRSFLVTVFLPSIIIFSYLIETALSNDDLFFFFRYFLSFSLPSVFLGAYCGYCGDLSKIAKWLDFVMIVITLGLFFALPDAIFNSVISLGGASYQQMGYMAAFAFLINLCGLLFGDSYNRFSFFRQKYYRIIAFILLFVQLIACFYSGGRGGFITLLAISVALLLYGRKIKYFGYAVFAFFVFYVVFSQFQNTIFYDVIIVRMERTFSFISSEGGIDTQNRGDVWTDSIDMIKNDSSLLGYGLFEYFNMMRVKFDQPYAHNFFLELILQGGIAYLVFWCIILFRAIKKIPQILQDNQYNVLLIPLGLYPFIELQFSDTYLKSSLFWFVLSFIWTYMKNYEFSSLSNRINP